MSRKVALEISLILVLSAFFRSGTSSPADHRYNVGDQVPLFVNRVGPFNNPSETYQYYELPFCHPDIIMQKKGSLGELLNGDNLKGALYELKFREHKTEEILCHKKLKADEVARFRNAVVNDFYFQMYYDDLPFWGFIGKIEDGLLLGEKETKYYLFKHIQFDANYNGNQVIEMRAFSDPNHVVDITENVDIDVTFTYSVFWNATTAPFDTRMDRYSRASSLPVQQRIHWFFIVNSVAIFLLSLALVTMIVFRHLENDLKNKRSTGDVEEEAEFGWKHIHGDVFRCPPNLSLFSAVIGTGTQLLTLVCCLFVLVFLDVLHPYNRGAICSSLTFIFTLTSVIAGYSASSFHCWFNQTGWERSVLLAGTLYAGPFFLTSLILNMVAVSYGAMAAIPVGTIAVLILIYAFVTLPLVALGGAIGHCFRAEIQTTCAVKRYPREIPLLAWYQKAPCQMFLSGFVSFSAITLELYHFFTSLWFYKIYTLPSLVFGMFIILVLLTAVLSVGLTYIQLSVEDHEWWWRSVLRGGSTAIFMFAYCIYFYARSNMSGLLQLSFFIGYSACLCYAVFLMLGTISLRSSLILVQRIYRAEKSE